MSSSAAVADHLPPPPNPSGNREPQSVQPSLHGTKSPHVPSSPPLTDRPLKNGDHGTDANESEAETVILSAPEKDEATRPKMMSKPNSTDQNRPPKEDDSRPASNGLQPANRNGPERLQDSLQKRPHHSSGRKASSSSSSSSSPSSCEHDPPSGKCTHGSASSSARTRSHSPPPRDNRARSSSMADSRKRKLREKENDVEPPRQRHKTEGPAKSSRTPASPLAAGVKFHKRSASTQSSVRGSSGPKRREHARHEKDWASDDSDESNDSSPHAQNIASLNRPKRLAQRSMTSPVRAIAPAKRKDAFGATRLLRSCEKGDYEAVRKAFAAAPEELDAPDYAGVTPLQKAALNGHEDIVEFLLDQGCATDGHDWLDNDTPLIDATQNAHLEVVKLLLWKARVDPLYENKHFKTALQLLDPTIDEADEIRIELEKAAAEWRKGKKERSEDESEAKTPKSVEESVVPTLLPNEYNAEVLRIKSEQGDKRAVDELLASGVMPNVACGVAAARGGHDEILSFLLATGLSADHRDPAKHNETPMLVAIRKGHLNVIKLLLAQDDFDPTRRNRDGLTYWEYAQDYQGPNWKEVHRVLKAKYDEVMMARSSSSSSKRLRSPEMRRTDQRSPRRSKHHVEPEGLRRTRDRDPRPRHAEKRAKEDLESHKPKKRLISRRELNRQSTRESSSPDASDEDEDEIRGPSRSVRRKTAHHSKTIRSSPPPPSSPIDTKSEPSPEPMKTEPEPEPEPVKEETPECVREERRMEAERAAAERARKEAEEAAERARLEAEQRERERLERMAKLPRSLRRACEKGANRPLRFNLATKEGGIEYNFLPVHVARRCDLEPMCPESQREQLWMLSFQAVGILGLSELDFTADFPTWERKDVTTSQRHAYLETYDISQLSEDPLFERQDWPGYDPEVQHAMKQEDKFKFLAMDPLYWIRYDDLIEATKMPKFAHLAPLDMRTAKAKVTTTTETPPPTPKSWSEALFGIKPGPDFERRSLSRSVSVSAAC